MSEYLEAWKSRCPYNTKCTVYHHMDYECRLDQSKCVLYGVFSRNMPKETQNNTESNLEIKLK